MKTKRTETTYSYTVHKEGRGRVAAKIFVFVFSQNFGEHEIEFCAKFSRNSKEISRNTKHEIIINSFVNDYRIVSY